MTELLATLELLDDGSVTVHMRDRRCDPDTLTGIALAAVAAADAMAKASEDPDPIEQPGQDSEAGAGTTAPQGSGQPAPVTDAGAGPASDGEARPASDPPPERKGFGTRRAELARESQRVIRSHGSYTCPECGREFSMPVGLATHRRKAHQPNGVDAGVAQPEEHLAASQDVAGSTPVSRSIPAPVTIRAHQLPFTPGQYACFRCRRNFTDGKALAEHRRTH